MESSRPISAIDIIEKIRNHKSDPDQAIAILKDALDKGFKFTEYNVGGLVEAGGLEVVKYYLQRPIPFPHVLRILESSKDHPEIFAACLDRQYFPDTRQLFSAYNVNGTSLITILQATWRIKGLRPHADDRVCYHVDAIKLLFEKRPGIIDAFDIIHFQKNLMLAYHAAKEDENALALVRKTLLLVCQHVECKFSADAILQASRSRDVFVKSEFSLATNTYPLYWAAMHGEKEIFDLFYDHPDTDQLCKVQALEFLRVFNQHDLLQEVFYRPTDNMVLFYLGLKDSELLPLEVILLMIKDWMDARHHDFLRFYHSPGTPARHLLDDLLCWFDTPEMIAACLDHKNFPKTPEEFSACNDGKSLRHFCATTLHINGENKRILNAVLIKLLIQKRPDLLIFSDLTYFRDFVMSEYDKAENETEKNDLKNTLHLICQHPKYELGYEVEQPKKLMLCLPPKTSAAGLFAIETIANNKDENDIFNIQAAAQRAIDCYREWYRTGESYRGKSGFLAGINHGKNGLERAWQLEADIYHHSSKNVVEVINDFLKDSYFKNHSLSQFLLDQLVKLDSSPWADVKKRYPGFKNKTDNAICLSKGKK